MFRPAIIILLLIFFISSGGALFSQILLPLEGGVVEENQPGSNSINFDGRMLAGLNGDSIFFVSMTQGLRNFAYQLNSATEYTNDFEDYNNTSFITNETGFTGELNITDTWKMIPEFEIGNSSYGMFDNDNDNTYSREKKDKIRIRLKNEYKPAPARWDFDVNLGRFDHRLKDVADSEENEKTFYSSNLVFGFEYIWSAANKVGMRHELSSYEYEDGSPSDLNTYSEFYGSFKITEFVMLTIAPVFSWDSDGTNFLYFRGNVSTIGFKYFSFELLHNYILEPYRPDEYMYSHKFVELNFELPPSTINHSELSGEFEYRVSGAASSPLSVRSFRVKSSGIFETNNNLHNYSDNGEGLLYVDPVSAAFFNSKTEIVTKILFNSHKIEFQLIYDFFKYYTYGSNSDINITYRPENIFSCNIVFETGRLVMVWANRYNSDIYIDPAGNAQMDGMIEGELNLNFRIYDTFYLHSRINNLYDEQYSLREGYPEPGRQFFFGLRVMI